MTKPARKSSECSSPRVLAPLFVLAAVLLGSAAYTRALRPVDPSATASRGIVHIPESMGVAEIGALLSSKGFVRSPVAFRIRTLLSGQEGRLQSGYYEVSSDMALPEVIRLLAQGRRAVRNVTLPEGLTRARLAEIIGTELFVDGEAFESAASAEAVEEALRVQLPSAVTSAEGYLFPETYRFELGTAPQVAVKRMLKEFRQRFLQPLWEPTPPGERWGTLHEVVTLASLVEAEARVDRERALIAGVLRHRLEQGIKLQCDATVQYALPARKARLTYEDLKVESPYNTYLYKGLPPGPICSPGLASLQAALRPTPTAYLYYVARGDGTHVFSRSYREHQAAISRLRASGAR